MNPITYVSINSAAKIQAIIRQKEQIHWYLGLRQCELEIRSTEVFLHESEQNLKDLQAQIGNWEKRISTGYLEQNEELNKQIAANQMTIAQLSPEIRDAHFMMSIAQGERDRILDEHPESLNLSYEDLQMCYAHVAYLEEQAHFVASRIWAAQRALPESVGDLLFSATPEQRRYIMARETELRTQVQAIEVLTHADAVLKYLSPEEQQIVDRAQQVLSYRELEAAVNGARE